MLSGDGGTGKSLLSLQLACAVALGHQWIGFPVASGRAMFVSAEDDVDELHRRVIDITRADAVTLANLDRLTIRSLAGEDALLAMLTGRTGALVPSPLFYELDRRIETEQPALVILDTLADLFPGNENDRAQARHFIGLLRGLAIRHACAVVVLAHPSLSGLNSGSGTSGSTGWNNSVRSRLYFERVLSDGYEQDPNARALRTMKANYGRTGGEIRLMWREGVFAARPEETGLDRMARNAKAERVFLKLLRTFDEQGRTVSESGGRNYAPKAFSEHPDSEGCTKAALKNAMDALFSKGAIRLEKTGPASKQRRHIVLGGSE
jgi:RecA-family ATPase